MLGDTAVAVHPTDERYSELHGKLVMLPLMNRAIPIITDQVADPEFGTGVVKVTPAHDPNDFEAGQRHNLPRIKVIDELGQMTTEAGAYAGLDRFEARKRVVADLDALGLLERVDPYKLALGKCQRCKAPVEPMISTQWFVKMKPLAEPAIQTVKDGRVRFVPEMWSKTYFEWMNNIRDWCISRQLWWGHRIPAWHCEECGKTTVSRTDPTACGHWGSAGIEHDPDVLDTWFSSALWPFSTLGWPEQTDDLRTYYPTNLLITGFDILFFWVARMIMMGLEFMGDVPFREVYIHGLVRDAERQKMSKTRGNVVDPLEIIEDYGTDAVRLTLAMGAGVGSDIVLSDERILGARAFVNKIWNAARFLFLSMERSSARPWLPEERTSYAPEPSGNGVALEDRWIFSRLNRCADLVNRAIGGYRYKDAAEVVWQFIWHEFCDWYVELKKLRFAENSGLTADWRNMLTVFESALRLLHPVAPFVSEELWQRLQQEPRNRPVSVSVSRFPQFDPEVCDAAAEQQMELLQDIVTSARNLRADLKADPKQLLEGALYSQNEAYEIAASHLEAIGRLANVKLELKREVAARLSGAVRSTTGYDLALHVPAAQLETQRKRLEKEIQQLEKVIAGSRRQLTDDTFLSRAPAHVVAGIRHKLTEYEAQLEKSRAAMVELPRA